MRGRILARRAVPPQLDGRIQGCDCGVDAAIPIKVGKDYAAMQGRLLEIGADGFSHVFKTACPVAKDAIGLRILRVETAPGYEKIEPSVVVEIDEATAPA